MEKTNVPVKEGKIYRNNNGCDYMILKVCRDQWFLVCNMKSGEIRSVKDIGTYYKDGQLVIEWEHSDKTQYRAAKNHYEVVLKNNVIQMMENFGLPAHYVDELDNDEYFEFTNAIEHLAECMAKATQLYLDD